MFTGGGSKAVMTGAAAWFALQVRPRCEVRATQELGRRGIEAFLPMQTVQRRWSDRVKEVKLPLFPGYLFGRFPMGDRLRVLNAPGVAQIVSAGAMPLEVPEAEIRSLRRLVESKAALVALPYLKEGERVEIRKGPLAGVEGVVLRAEGQLRVVVSVSLLMRSVAAELERDWLGVVG